MEFEVIIKMLPLYFQGLWVTIYLVLLSLAIGLGMAIPIALLATYACLAADMKEWVENAQINTDRNLRLQYLAGMSVNSFMQTEILNGILKYYKFPEDVFIGSSQRIQEMQLALQAANRMP